MFLVLEKPSYDKSISLFANDLAGDDNFIPHGFYTAEPHAERPRVDLAVMQANEMLGADRRKLFPMLFNQFRWTGTTGWEYWSDEHATVLKHALVVAQFLEQTLHVHIDSMDHIMLAAIGMQLPFDFDLASANELSTASETKWLRDGIAAGKYFQLKDIVIPNDWPRLNAW